MQSKKTVILDFDGVIHSYASGWKGANVIPDPPTKGAKEGVAELRKRYHVVVVSSRCSDPKGPPAIAAWLGFHGIEVDEVRADKPPHIVVVDDRALRFDGNWSGIVARVEEASTPWYVNSATNR